MVRRPESYRWCSCSWASCACHDRQPGIRGGRVRQPDHRNSLRSKRRFQVAFTVSVDRRPDGGRSRLSGRPLRSRTVVMVGRNPVRDRLGMEFDGRFADVVFTWPQRYTEWAPARVGTHAWANALTCFRTTARNRSGLKRRFGGAGSAWTILPEKYRHHQGERIPDRVLILQASAKGVIVFLASFELTDPKRVGRARPGR